MRTGTSMLSLVVAVLLSTSARSAPLDLRLYSILADTTDVSMDGAPLVRIEGGSVYFLRAEPGQHTFHTQLQSGEETTLTTSLAESDMVEGRGRKWWCLILEHDKSTGSLEFELADKDFCAKLVDKAPADDVPGDG